LVAEQPRPDDLEERDYDETGRVDLRFLRLTLPLRLFHFYVCGPPPMMEALIPDLLDWGVPKRHIHFEAFGPASLPAELLDDDPSGDTAPVGDGESVSVTFARSERTVPFDGARSLLDLAENNGIRVEAVCRAGCCAACQTPVLEGEAEHLRAPDVSPAPGNVLLCLGRPCTDLILDA
jgi:ferredoxin